MKTWKLDQFYKGWIYGAFQPSIHFDKNTEVGIHYYKQGEVAPPHYHKKATEINIIISGKLIENEVVFRAQDIFVLSPGELSDTEFLEDTVIVVIKTPSVPGDKYV